MFILKKGHQPGVYVPLRALFLVFSEPFLVCSLSHDCHNYVLTKKKSRIESL